MRLLLSNLRQRWRERARWPLHIHCAHGRTTFPTTGRNGAPGSETVSCLDCGKSLPYSWHDMKIVRSSPRQPREVAIPMPGLSAFLRSILRCGPVSDADLLEIWYPNTEEALLNALDDLAKRGLADSCSHCRCTFLTEIAGAKVGTCGNCVRLVAGRLMVDVDA